MENSEEKAWANPEPPDMNKETEILKELLIVEKNRLEIAVRIEEKRDIVFPETSVIIHDIMKLANEIEKREKPKQIEQSHIMTKMTYKKKNG